MMSDIKNYLSNSSWQDVFFKYSTYFFVGTLPLYLNLNTIALWFFVISSILVFRKHGGYNNLKENTCIWIPMVLLYVLFLLGLWLSKDVHRVQNDIGRVFPLVLIPLFTATHRKEDFNIKRIYISLGSGVFIGMLICWYNIFTSIMSRKNYIKQASYFFEWIYTDFNLVKPLDVHPSYFAILLVIFVSGLLFDKSFKNIRKQRFKFSLIIIPFFLFLIETNSRVGILALLAIVAYHVIRQFSLKLFVFWGVLVFTTVFLAVKFNYLGTKFKKTIASDGSFTIERVERWKEIIKVFNANDRLWFGVGSGDARLVYRRAYYNGGFDLALKENYNAHNQYLEFFVSNGVLGLFVYLLIFLSFFLKTSSSLSAVHFFIVFILFSMSESFLGRAQGVMIFSFFYAFLVLYFKPTPILKDVK